MSKLTVLAVHVLFVVYKRLAATRLSLETAYTRNKWSRNVMAQALLNVLTLRLDYEFPPKYAKWPDRIPAVGTVFTQLFQDLKKKVDLTLTLAEFYDDIIAALPSTSAAERAEHRLVTGAVAASEGAADLSPEEQVGALSFLFFSFVSFRFVYFFSSFVSFLFFSLLLLDVLIPGRYNWPSCTAPV